MTDLNIYRPTGTVRGPVLAADIPEGWEWMYADHVVESPSYDWHDRCEPAPIISFQLYLVRPPAIKAGDRVRKHDNVDLVGFVLLVTDGNDGQQYLTVKWDDIDRPEVLEAWRLVAES